MKFLIDAQLPRKLTQLIKETGHCAMHTLELPKRNKTTDTEILKYVNDQDCVLVTKDQDFVNSFLVSRHPDKSSSPAEPVA
jgi:predicted nuclease of predicted toxin-antitoxin system